MGWGAGRLGDGSGKESFPCAPFVRLGSLNHGKALFIGKENLGKKQSLQESQNQYMQIFPIPVLVYAYQALRKLGSQFARFLVSHCHLTAFPADCDFFRNGKDQTPWGKWVEKFPLHVIGHRMYSSHLGEEPRPFQVTLDGFPGKLLTETNQMQGDR